MKLSTLLGFGWILPVRAFQQPLQSAEGFQLTASTCKTVFPSWTAATVGPPWPDLKTEFDLKLERAPGDEVVYHIRRFDHDGNTGVVFQVLSKDKKKIIAYAKTPKDNTEFDMKHFCNELEATGDVKQYYDGGMQQTGTAAGKRPWLLVKPMTGTTIFENELYRKVHLDAKKCSKLASHLFDLYMLKTYFYMSGYHWWHHDTNMDNAFWNADLTSVNFIDWGNAVKVPPNEYDDAKWRAAVLKEVNDLCIRAKQ